MDGYREMGSAGMQVQGRRRSTPEEDAERVRAAREAAGDDFVLTIDANQGYALPRGARALPLVDGARHPLVRGAVPAGANDRRDMRVGARSGGIPVCAGQTEYSAAGCRDLMEAGASTCATSTPRGRAARPTGRAWQRWRTPTVSRWATTRSRRSRSTCSQSMHGTYVECFHPDRDPFWWNLIANRPELEDGALPLPDGPGLGWKLDTDYIDRHRVDL